MTNPILLIAILVVAIVVFLLFREILAWYSKINDRIYLLKENNFLLRKLAEQMGAKPEELQYHDKKKK